MKYQLVYTVVVDLEDATCLNEALDSLLHVSDDVAEFLDASLDDGNVSVELRGDGKVIKGTYPY